MSPEIVGFHLFALVIEGLGVWLLYREVRIAQEFEEIDAGWTQIERILTAIRSQEWEQANLEINLHAGHALQFAQTVVADTRSRWQQNALDWSEANQAPAVTSMERWYHRTRPAQFKVRRLWLNSGAVCLLAAIAMEGGLIFFEWGGCAHPAPPATIHTSAPT
jgi:hypothetical protein